MAAQSPLVGYNTNVRHKGKLYHIQTEDSGVSHPHVITHLFADGGRIIASRKTGYAEHLGAKELASIVKKLMQEQHKAMFIELRDCVYDTEPPPAEPANKQADAADVQAAPPQPKVAAEAPAPQPVAAARPEPQPPPAAARPPRLPSVANIPAPLGRAGEAAAAPPPLPLAAAAAPPPLPAAVVAQSKASAQSQSVLRAASPLSQDDIDAFDRAAEARLVSSILGKARSEAGRRGLGRYQQTVSAKPVRPQRPASRSIFGGEALRGKSLDEVILSYLSDDAGETER